VELRDYLAVLRRRWVSLLVVALTVLVAVAAVTFSMTKQYTATTRLFFAVSDWTRTAANQKSRATFPYVENRTYRHLAPPQSS
jgi:uncharacterized protein involved in exopolysaccharide biosynthesis